LILLFPNGKLPSRRWRPVAWILIAGPAFNIVTTALRPGFLFEQYGVRVENPFGVTGFVDPEGSWLAFIIPGLLWVGAAVSSVVALVQRFRRATGEERQQLKWLAYVAGTAAALFVPGMILTSFGLGRIYGVASVALFLLILFIGIPAASAMAILRYRLFDIDVVIKKTVVFGALAVFVSAMYIGIVVGIGSAVTGSETSPVSVLTFVAAAVLALAFQPVRRRANHLANRLVYGGRATPYEVLSRFSDRVAGAYSDEDVLPRMAEILAGGTGAKGAQVWLRVGDRLRLVASWPQEPGRASPALSLSGEELPEFPESWRAFPVRHHGEVLGAVATSFPASDPLTPSKEKLIQDLAAQAGLVLRNARLIEELRDSRQRIVTAQDARAKALERNIHDGAQQQLVALMVKLRLAEGQADRNPERVRQVLHDLQKDAEEALDVLRELARGIYPPLLADRGLVDALASQARRAAVHVTVDGDGIGRYPQEAEAAVYFCCLEALQNVAKYAAASRVRISLIIEGDQLVFRVQDDGAGFDTSAASYGSGLQNMDDRLAALGGSVKVDSEPGRGTTVIGRIPAGPLAPAL
jgi:signal transduction histidine kinase